VQHELHVRVPRVSGRVPQSPRRPETRVPPRGCPLLQPSAALCRFWVPLASAEPFRPFRYPFSVPALQGVRQPVSRASGRRGPRTPGSLTVSGSRCWA
jgi:hypothetical protein